LAEADLPEPSRIQEAVNSAEEETKNKQLNADLAKMPLGMPEALVVDEDEQEIADARDALQEAISGLTLPAPERYMRANMKADGRRTPEPM